MSTRLETLQVAKLAPRMLGESAELVADFFRSQIAADGGFRGRGDASDSDLYYTIFGLDGLHALGGEQPDGVAGFLRRFGDGSSVPDLVHLGSLMRSWAALDDVEPEPSHRDAWIERLAGFRQDDGGWSAEPDGDRGSVYGTFIAVGAYQDAGVPIPDVDAAIAYLDARAMPDGGYAPDAELAVSTMPTTAAAVDALRQLGATPNPEAADWLRRLRHPGGGFLAADGAPMPDLLSTAIALHTLSALGADLDDLAD
ncbi:MAG: prenyltransferase/squalene oxidase repeat-containing protein, partial [Acidobacteriota bacterium]